MLRAAGGQPQLRPRKLLAEHGRACSLVTKVPLIAHHALPASTNTTSSPRAQLQAIKAERGRAGGGWRSGAQQAAGGARQSLQPSH